MQQQEQEMNYLLTYDRRDQRLKGVTGIGSDNELETADPTSQNKHKFMRVDPHGNFFTNFGKNFEEQFNRKFPDSYNRPNEQSIYSVPDAETPEAAVDRIQTMHESQDPAVRKELNSSRIYNNNRFNACEIDLKAFGEHGVTQEALEKDDNLKKLILGKGSGELEVGGEPCRVFLKRDENGKVFPDIHFVQEKIDYTRPYFDHNFTEKNIAGLNSDTGNMGETALLTFKGETKPCFVSQDTVTNELRFLPVSELHISEWLNGRKIPQDQYEKLKAGQETDPLKFKSATGKEYWTSLQVNAIDRGVEMLFDRGINAQLRRERAQEFKEKQAAAQTVDGKEVKEPGKEMNHTPKPKVSQPKNTTKKGTGGPSMK